MLAIGDKVVYPMHGAGVIEAIEQHEVLGQCHDYYILTMPYGGMRVMIPLDKTDNIGLRAVITPDEIEAVANVLREPCPANTISWNKRLNLYLSKIKSGDIFEVAEVVRNLARQDVGKKLSAGERRLLDTARKILISELVLACGKDVAETEIWVTALLQETGMAGD